MMYRNLAGLGVMVAAAMLGSRSHAASLASDNAADAAYNSGWTNGSNGGSGWGSAWTISTTGDAATFVGNSASNGDGDTDPPTGDINSPQSASGRAWGSYASTSSFFSAKRLFNGALNVGQTFHFQMDNGGPTLNQGAIEVLLLNAAGDEVWNFSTDSTGNYYIFGEFGFAQTGLTSSDEGIDVNFTVTSSNGWKATIGVLGTEPIVIEGYLYNNGTGFDVSSVLIFAGTSGLSTDPSRYVYFNNFEIRDPAQVVAATGAVSRRNHNGPDFDVSLPLTGAAGIESRLGSTLNQYTIVLELSGPPDLPSGTQAEIISGIAQLGNSVSVVGNTVTIPLTGVVSQQQIKVRLNALNSAGGIVVPMKVLVGDANGDGFVNAADATITRNLSGQNPNATTFRADFNVDGNINAADATIARNRSGQSVSGADRVSAERRR